MIKNTTEIQRQKIRQEIRLKRQQLSHDEQIVAANKVLHIILQHNLISNINHVALFLSFDGELNTSPLIEYLWMYNKNIYLPVLHPFSSEKLLFLHYRTDTVLIKNRFNIAEPMLNIMDITPIARLDILFVPLVAFDKQGQRLGMGGGFYDRILFNWRKKHFYPVGLAHDYQLVNQIPSSPWDIPLPEIITPSKRWCWQ